MILKLRINRGGAHVDVTQFMGVDADHLQNVGSLVLGVDQWPIYHGVLAVGVASPSTRITELIYEFSIDPADFDVDTALVPEAYRGLSGGRESMRGHLQREYEGSKGLAGTRDSDDFYTPLMAAMRQADTANAALLKAAFPDVWEELQERYDAPAGLLVGEENEDYKRTAVGMILKELPESLKPERDPGKPWPR